MKLINIINARNVLEEFGDNVNIGAKLSYWMTKFIAKTQTDYEFYINEKRKLYEKYADIEGDKYIVPAEKTEEFAIEFRILEQTEAEDPGIRFDLSELAAELKLSMRQMYPLLDFINEDK